MARRNRRPSRSPGEPPASGPTSFIAGPGCGRARLIPSLTACAVLQSNDGDAMTKEIADVRQAAEQNFRAGCLLHARSAPGGSPRLLVGGARLSLAAIGEWGIPRFSAGETRSARAIKTMQP